jgi:hypothetical protein
LITHPLASSFECWSYSLRSDLGPFRVCILLHYKINTCKFISPTWSCWSSNTKIQTKWAQGQFSLQSPTFWCLMTTPPKQANNNKCGIKNISTC